MCKFAPLFALATGNERNDDFQQSALIRRLRSDESYSKSDGTGR